jgi:hypothetical protein
VVSCRRQRAPRDDGDGLGLLPFWKQVADGQEKGEEEEERGGGRWPAGDAAGAATGGGGRQRRAQGVLRGVRRRGVPAVRGAHGVRPGASVPGPHGARRRRVRLRAGHRPTRALRRGGLRGPPAPPPAQEQEGHRHQVVAEEEEAIDAVPRR